MNKNPVNKLIIFITLNWAKNKRYTTFLERKYEICQGINIFYRYSKGCFNEELQ